MIKTIFECNFKLSLQKFNTHKTNSNLIQAAIFPSTLPAVTHLSCDAVRNCCPQVGQMSYSRSRPACCSWMCSL